MKRTLVSSLLKAVTFLVLFAAAAQSPAFAASVGPCPSGTVADILNTTCDIGNLRFSFVNFPNAGSAFFSENYMVNNGTGTYIYNNPWQPSDVGFTPASNGFTLSMSSTQSITIPGGNQSVNAKDDIRLNYVVEGLNGYLISGASLSSTGSLSASVTEDPSTGFEQAVAFFREEAFAISPCGGRFGCGFVTGQQVRVDGGVVYHDGISSSSGSPFSLGRGDIVPFYLQATPGTSVSWDPSTGFTFTLQAPTTPAVPEPASLLLLGSGLAGLGWKLRNRFKKS